MNGQLQFPEIAALEILHDLEQLRRRWSAYVLRFHFLTTPGGRWEALFGKYESRGEGP